MQKIRVLIAEDSLVSLKLLKHILEADGGFEIVGVADNGEAALNLANSLHPDVISMDFNMPVMDGYTATTRIMQECPTPIVIVSSSYQSSEIEMAMKVLEAGAVGIMPKPYGPTHEKYASSAKKFVNMLIAMAQVKVVRRKSPVVGDKLSDSAKLKNNVVRPSGSENYKGLFIGASAGGPQALRIILSSLPADFPLPVFIVQHIDSHFAEGFKQWLATFSALPVKIASDNEKIVSGVVYLPEGDRHLAIQSNGIVSSVADMPESNLRPSVSVLFRSAAKVYGRNAIVVLLSGMGKDGAEAMKGLRDCGAYTMAQNAESALVWGMPGEAVKCGAAIVVLSPEEIVKEIIRLTVK